MKTQIRRCIFETNSSSVHSVVILNDEDWRKWKNQETVVSRHGEFTPIDEVIKGGYDYEYDQEYIETTEAETEINGVKVHAVSIYASDY